MKIVHPTSSELARPDKKIEPVIPIRPRTPIRLPERARQGGNPADYDRINRRIEALTRLQNLKEEWKTWFAWHPVSIWQYGNYHWAFWRPVQRKRWNNYGARGGGWDYREFS